MSVGLRSTLFGLGVTLIAAPAFADSLFAPTGPVDIYARPGYRETYDAYPPVQHGLFGEAEPPPSIYGRPTYQERYNDYPPEGRSGFLGALTSGISAAPPPSPGPVYGGPPPVYNSVGRYNPALSGLPQSNLPDYQTQPPAYYGAPPAAYQPSSYAPSGGTYDPTASDAPASRQMNPIYVRQDVAYGGQERAGTILIDTPNKFLYLVQPGGHAIRYGIGVGRPGFAWSGVKKISRKAEWPGWTPPKEMLARRPDLPRHMDGGEANPLGARALYLGSSMYRIHGTNEPYTIGQNVSSGCIRMMNQDVIDLYGRVGVGTKVIVM